MTDDAPEEIEDGEWVRRDVVTEELAAENDNGTREEYDEVLDDLIYDGPIRSKTRHGAEYIQLTSLTAGRVRIVKNKARQASLPVRSIFQGGDGD